LLASISTAVFAKPSIFHGGIGSASAPTGTLLTTFTITNTTASTTKGAKRIGLPFGPNDVPAGTTLEIQRGGVAIARQQFDNRASYRFTNEGLKFCSASFVDSDFSSGESRTYSVLTKPGGFNNTSPVTLGDALSGSDYKVVFTGINGAFSGAIADITASLNTHAAIDSRVMKYESGGAVDSWQIWGETSHPQLIVIWYFSRWKDVSGNWMSNEPTPVLSMPWWDQPNKEKLTYNAILKNGATTLATYNSVEHLPHADWIMVRTEDDDQHADRIWDGAPRPTLIYKPDKAYWISTRLWLPYDTTAVYSQLYPTWKTYIPGRALAHRYGIDGGAGGLTFMGEGATPEADIIAFHLQTASDIRIMRVNAYVGLHVPYHTRSATVTTKPGKTADKARTLCPMLMQDERSAATPASYSDFTADGMPAADDFYNYVGFARAGWVEPPAGSRTMSDGTWDHSNGASHAVNYCNGALLWSGERYFLEAQLDCGANTIHERAPTVFSALTPIAFWTFTSTPSDGYAVYPGATQDQWRAIAGSGANPFTTRIAPHALNLLSTMGYIPDDDVQTHYVDALINHHAKFFGQSYDLLPASANGAWSYGTAPIANFMCDYFTIETYCAYGRTRLNQFKEVADYLAKVQISFPANNLTGMASCFHFRAWRHSDTTWDAVTNPFLSDGMLQSGDGGVTFPGGTTITTAAGAFPWTNGDIVIFPIMIDTNGSITPQTWPPEITAEQIYYVVGVPGTSSASISISATLGGAPISVTAWPTRDFLFKKFASVDPSKWLTVKNPTDYGLGDRAAFMVARHFGNPLATAADRDKYDAMYGAHPWFPRFHMASI
jgi:hypothetical protein